MRVRSALAVAVLGLGTLSACGNAPERASASPEGAEAVSIEGADRSVCRAEAEPVADATADLPSSWSFPPDTTAYDVEHREGVGTIVTAVTTTPFDDVLGHLNHREPGVRITDGETEPDDAEATWTAAGHTGRWAIRKSPTCPGETVIQVLSSAAG